MDARLVAFPGQRIQRPVSGPLSYTHDNCEYPTVPSLPNEITPNPSPSGVMNILLIEDSPDLASNVGEFLESRGHTVDYAMDGALGLQLATHARFDVAVLDLNLPRLDGLSVCRRIRESPSVSLPVLMLTARNAESDKLKGFEAGADDYLTKPFSLPELLARLEAILRRSRDTSTTGSVLQVADLALDVRSLMVNRAGQPVSIAPTPLRILEILMRSAPSVVTRLQLESAIWGEAPPDSDAALRGHIRALRIAIDPPGLPRLLHTIHGTGYRIALMDPH